MFCSAPIYHCQSITAPPRQVTDADGAVEQDNHYYPYGMLMGESSDILTAGSNSNRNPYLYGAKEYLTTAGANLYDFTARTYDPSIPLFHTQDPESSSYSRFNTYLYCGGDPVNFVDPNGCNPVYSTQGELIRVTDTGLQGTPYIIDISNLTEKQYRQMSDDDIKANDLGINGLVDDNALCCYYKSIASLPGRPDWDGYITLAEANDWYKTGNGQPLFADLRKIDLSGVEPLGEENVERNFTKNLLWYSASAIDGLVYGTITLKQCSNNEVRAYDDKYDFDIKESNSLGSMFRNFLTKIGAKVAGLGTPYPIQFYGTAKLISYGYKQYFGYFLIVS